MYEAVLENLETVLTLLGDYTLTEEEKTRVEESLKELARRLISHPKTAKWKLRSVVGKHAQWCETVEE